MIRRTLHFHSIESFTLDPTQNNCNWIFSNLKNKVPKRLQKNSQRFQNDHFKIRKFQKCQKFWLIWKMSKSQCEIIVIIQDHLQIIFKSIFDFQNQNYLTQKRVLCNTATLWLNWESCNNESMITSILVWQCYLWTKMILITTKRCTLLTCNDSSCLI